MTPADQLAEIDRLRTRAFAEDGPGYHLVELSEGGAVGGAAEEASWEQASEQCEADCDALVTLLSARWGRADPFSVWSLSVRSASGEKAPASWVALSHLVDYVTAWQANDRWIAVGTARRDRGRRPGLLVLITGDAPP
ncbi:hypothetical protein [Streptomyces sp. MUM 178J]|uniref:hypothetical protein n=1 Tax=Streptomyces sp. MUM 178J TaxID=2791991 RepID=UPI001F0387FD|nr:hypothetical protein [Streptomyces sp. MUM 178J]WRQ78324.1 hypothetical protein I3F59_002380 [Streptomyces sp. MUM 178J]